MTYWRDSTALWTADESVHAGITRGVLQDNATVLGEQAKSDIDSEALGCSLVILAASGSGNWESSAWLPQPIRCLYTFDGLAWRDIAIRIRCEKAGAGNCTLRAFLLDSEAPRLISVAGTIGDFDYVNMAVPAPAAPAWVGGNVTPSQVELRHLGADLQFVWVHLYIAGTIGVHIHNVRIVEGSA